MHLLFDDFTVFGISKGSVQYSTQVFRVVIIGYVICDRIVVNQRTLSAHISNFTSMQFRGHPSSSFFLWTEFNLEQIELSIAWMF